MNKKETINVQGTEVTLYSQRKDQYISLTDMAKFKNSEIPATVISHWMSTVFSVNFMLRRTCPCRATVAMRAEKQKYFLPNCLENGKKYYLCKTFYVVL